ncbi:MFS transporter [Phaeobacter gallaeciensis]|uniref:MFS-type transporter n=1 Tax=Phaeobacter gallaeciensis TaxID=60890 RepID=A0AAC9ZAZ9_9RHOB|nr:MFS transporter [Phaeobacter gallaeciensis]AHD10602.1 Cyanate permease [Phaeobacter gallaeciensis DSM 26640]ATE93865.1 putative MFS-type transporter [Phaeobacter gallaeciensis]ATE96314.1 putative MFS-type transporter [Phaeobacter gallaeciensis]ATF02529.1 putative MFS-type transporter [Phaeobacter gallaeciensis]ATF06909.1 putative MFS-type transporter [Phaeobacter gallaeciensis]
MFTSVLLDSRYSWTRLLVTLAIATVANVGMWAVIVVMPAIEVEFGADRAAASLPYTLTMIGFAVGNLVIGRLVDRFGITLALCAAALLSAVSYGLAMLAPDMIWLSAAHLFLGLGTAAGFGPLIADISHWFQRRRGIAVALVASGNYLSGAIWPTALADMLAESGWRSVYATLAIVTLLAVVPLSLVLRRRIPFDAQGDSAAASASNAARAGLTPRQLQWILGLAGIGCCVAMSMPQVHIVAYCVGLGYGPTVGAEMLSLMLLGGVVSRVISGLVADRFGGVRTLLVGSILQCIALFFYLPYDGMVSLYLVSAIFGLAQGGIVPSYALVVREYMPPQEAGTRVGFVMMMTILGMALGGWMSGWIYDVSGSYQLAFVNGIFWNGLNIAIMVLLLMRSRPARPRMQPA